MINATIADELQNGKEHRHLRRDAGTSPASIFLSLAGTMEPVPKSELDAWSRALSPGLHIRSRRSHKRRLHYLAPDSWLPVLAKNLYEDPFPADYALGEQFTVAPGTACTRSRRPDDPADRRRAALLQPT